MFGRVVKHISFGLLIGLLALIAQKAHADCSTVTEIPVSECQSLMDLYNNTNGINWKNKSGWNQTNTPCSWFGVTCDAGHVGAINLSDDGNTSDTIYGNGLKGSLPNLNLPYLLYLAVGSNQLTGNIPNFNLPSLVGLYLWGNQFSGTVPNFSNLLKLQYIDFSENQLSGEIPNFSNVPLLEILSLWGNQLSGNIPNFSNLPKLQRLSLWTNKLSGNIPNFSNLPSLENLDLSDNQLSGNIPNFSNVPKLQILSLFKNQLSGTIPNFTSFSLSSLKTAYFGFNCGLTAYDDAQKSILIQKDKSWDSRSSSCSNSTLTLSKVGKGNVSATGISCGTDCSETYDVGTSVTLVATADAEYTFGSWSGDCSGNTNTCSLTMNASKSVTANFTDHCSAVTEIPVSECQSLVNLYNSTDGANWKNKTNWNKTNTPCTWFGVTCSGGHIQKIDLSDDGNTSDTPVGNNLKGTIPELNLPYLEILYLKSNQLTGNIPSFSNMSKLQKLALSSNQLTGSIPNFNLPNLIGLYLWKNQLSGSVPDFSNLPKLQGLDLSDNQLSGNIPNFSGMPNLGYLDLFTNQLTGSVPNFSNLPKLQELDLSSNQLSGNVPNFNSMSNLQYLGLSTNQLTGSIPNFANLPVLQEIYLWENQLTGNIPNFSNLPKLQKLALSSNQLTGNIPNFSYLPNLQYLTLFLNRLSGTIPNFTAFKLADLQTAYFSNNCGLVAYDAAQKTILTQKDPKWEIRNSNCSTAIYSLTTSKVGNGKISATGIDCGADCIDPYDVGTQVNLTATPETGYIFSSWSGDCSGNTNTCSLTINSAKNVIANFSACTYSLNPSSKNHNASRETGSISVINNGCAWTAKSNASWITITSQDKGVVNYSVAANATNQDRNGTLTIADQTFTITQKGNQPPIANFTVNPSSGNAPLTVNVDASNSKDNDGSISDYQWQTSNSQVSVGVKTTLIFDKLGTHTITLTVRDNLGEIHSQTQSISVTGITDAVCNFNLVPNASSILKAEGESGSFVLTTTQSDCSWNAAASENWINLLNSNGNGTGTVNYKVEPNPSTKERTSTIVVNAQIFTIKQAGKTPIAPIAQFTATPKLGEIPLQVNLDASKSNDPDGGDLVSYEWLAVKDDAQIKLTAQGKETSFRFDQEGFYIITLKVTDNEGQTTETSQTINAGISKLSFNTYRCANSDLNGFSGCQINSEQSPYYTVGSKLKVALDSQTATNRFERLDLWTAIQLPDGQFLFMTSQPFNRFKFNQPPEYNGEAFMPNVEFANREDTVLEFDVPRNMSGKYTFYALYVALGKNPLLDSSSWKSNLAIKEITLE